MGFTLEDMTYVTFTQAIIMPHNARKFSSEYS